MIGWLRRVFPLVGASRRDSAVCALCVPPRRWPLFMLFDHLEHDHGLDRRALENAPVVEP